MIKIPDRTELIKSSQPRWGVIEFGDGVTGGEVIDMHPFVKDGVKYQEVIIKMSEELKARFNHLMTQQDLRENFVSWIEFDILLIPITRNPSAPRIFALRSFDRKDTDFTLREAKYLEAFKSMRDRIDERDKAYYSLQEDFRKFAEGSIYLKLEEIMRKVMGELIKEIYVAQGLKKAA